MQKVLFVITKSVWGGAAKYVYDLAVGLAKDQFKTAVAAGPAPFWQETDFIKKIKDADIPYFEIANFQRRVSPARDILAVFEILSLLRGLKPDIVHVSSSKAGGAVGLAGWIYKIFTRQKPLFIFTAHGWAFAEDKPAWQKWLVKFFSKVTALFYDKIICVSEFDRKLALKNKTAPTEKLLTIHNGIEIEKIKFLPKEEARQKLFANRISPIACLPARQANRYIVGTIAEWNKNKGINYLLEAIEQLKDKKFEFVLIGGGENPDKEKILAFIKNRGLKNIHLFENLENAASYLKAFDLFLLPSVKEGLPYTILEAMAGGVPIVATYVGGVPELISDQKTGFLIARKSSAQIADEINYLSQHPELTSPAAQAAQQKAAEKFTLKKMLEETIKVYHQK